MFLNRWSWARQGASDEWNATLVARGYSRVGDGPFACMTWNRLMLVMLSFVDEFSVYGSKVLKLSQSLLRLNSHEEHTQWQLCTIAASYTQ